MIINKNNGIIQIEPIKTNTRRFTGVKVLEEYSIVAKDKGNIERFKGFLKVVEVSGITKYRFGHNCYNKDLVSCIVQELKKYKYIK